MNRSYLELWKRVTPILLISLLLSIGISCRQPKPKIYPIDTDELVVRFLENGNCEVKPGWIDKYFQLIRENVLLKMKLKKYEDKE